LLEFGLHGFDGEGTGGFLIGWFTLVGMEGILKTTGKAAVEAAAVAGFPQAGCARAKEVE
jgi:hypothetical protein